MQGRFTDDEIEVIKGHFANDDKALKIIRKVFYQIPLTDSEKEMKEDLFSKPEVMRVVRKILLPEITGDEPVNMVVDWWKVLQVKQNTPEQADCYLDSRQLSIDYVAQQLEVLDSTRERGAIDFDGLLKKDEDTKARYVNFISRNEIIDQIEGGLTQLMVLAENKGAKEIIEQMQKQIQQNSSK